MTQAVSPRRVSVADNMKTLPNKPRATFGVRHFQALLIAFGFFCCYALRVVMSVAVVAMTSKENERIEPLSWTESQKSCILSSFFWGYVLTQMPGGIMAQHWGAHRIYALAVGLCGLASLAIPMAAWTGRWELICACRVFCGLCQGVVPPVLHTLLAKWIPLTERGTFTSFVYSGGWIGNVIALQSSGLICSSRLGWPSCFYFWGMFAIMWSIIWYKFGRESPAEHSYISDDERNYIESSLGVVEITVPLKTPWKSILTSAPVWSLLVAQSAQTWGFWMLLMKIPSYMSSVLSYDIQASGFMSSLPYLSAWLMSFPVSFASDFAIRRDILSVKSSRMLCNTLGMTLPGIGLMVLGFITKEHEMVAVVVLILSVTSNVAIYCGHHSNHMDLSPNFAGPLMGFTNGFANLGSIVAPLVAGVLIEDTTKVGQWQSVFLLTAVIWIFGALIFLMFGSVAVQNWNDTPVQNSKKQSIIFGIHQVPTIPETLKDLHCYDTNEKIER